MIAIGAGTWTVDAARSTAAFAARGMMIHTVHGTIAVRSGSIEVDAGGRPRRLTATLDSASIDTGNARRDADLRSARFLGADAHPELVVVAERVDARVDGWHADAILRVRGAEAPVRIVAALAGLADASRLRVTATGRLDLRTAGIRAPGFLVGRYVDLSVTAQLVRTT
jgi:polyisoprenoid-binding protein YceI